MKGYIFISVVAVRQLERQMTREKERSSEHLSTVEEHFKRQLDLLQGQLKAVEKERNLMMVRANWTYNLVLGEIQNH